MTVAQVEQTQGWAAKHGFRLAGFRSLEKAVDDSTIEAVRAARAARAAGRK